MILELLTVMTLAQGLPIKSGATSDLATVNAKKALLTVDGQSTAASYTCVATGLTTTAAYSMQLDSEASRGFRIKRICVGTTVATAAALQTVTVQRRTTASTGGTAATSEGTASPAVSRHDPGDSTYTGRCAVTPTLGTAGAVLDGWGYTIGELGAGAADTNSQMIYCRDYSKDETKGLINASGTANGISVNVSSAGAGGLAAGSISITFIAE